MTPRILVVDDEKGFRDLLEYELSDKGMLVETAENGVAGLRRIKEKSFDLVITDITMPEMDGLKFLETIKKIAPRTQVIVVTGFGTVETAVHALNEGACHFLLKPYDMQGVFDCIEKALKQDRECRSCRRTL